MQLSHSLSRGEKDSVGIRGSGLILLYLFISLLLLEDVTSISEKGRVITTKRTTISDF
jgi:hypothetical protein